MTLALCPLVEKWAERQALHESIRHNLTAAVRLKKSAIRRLYIPFGYYKFGGFALYCNFCN